MLLFLSRLSIQISLQSLVITLKFILFVAYMFVMLLRKSITFEHVNNISQKVFEIVLKLRLQTLLMLSYLSLKNVKRKFDKIVI